MVKAPALTQRVMLIHPSRQAMGAARRRAEGMAKVLGAQLVVVKLARPGRARAHVLFPQVHEGEVLRSVTVGLREARAVERWQAARRRKGLASVEVLASPPTVEGLVEAAATPGVALVVLPASLGWFASGVTGLAARAGVPVLLAHALQGQERLVVGTNLEDPQRPVIRRALDFAARLEAPLTIVHNSPELREELAAATAAAGLPPLEKVADASDAVVNELAAAGQAAEVTVKRRGDAVTGILEAAQEQDADVIVVGVRARTAPGLFAERVAERLCASARRSVLLVPV